MKTEDIYKKINRSLNEWHFDNACNQHEELLKHTFQYFSDYIKLLADFGKLDTIYNVFDRNGFIFIEGLTQDTHQKYPDAIDFCLKFIKERFIPSRYSPMQKNASSMLLHLSFNKEKSSLLEYLTENSNSLINKTSSAQDNMVLNYALNQLFDADLVNSDLCIKVIQNLVENPQVNNMRKKYLLSKVLDLSIRKNYTSFFKLRNEHYNHIQKVSHLIHKNINESGAYSLYGTFNAAILKHNSTNVVDKINKKPRVAVCISGMFRGNDLAIRSLYKNIIDPLGADVFLHSWDVWQSWSGICGAGLDSWTWRLFGETGRALCPDMLKSFANFKSLFPLSAKTIESPVYKKFTSEFMLSFLKPTSFLIENEDDFLQSLMDKENYQTRGNFNQAKMFYGIYKSTKLMMQYEIDNDIKYDYVVRARPDCAVVDKLTFDLLDRLKANEISVDMALDVGPIDQFYISRRDTHVKMADLWRHSTTAGRISPFESFPKYDAHALMYLRMLEQKITPVKPLIKRDFSLVNSKTNIPEELNKSFAHDFKNSASHLINNHSVTGFVEYLLMDEK